MRPFPLFPSMTRRRLGLLAFALLVPFGAAVRAETEAPSRIVSLGGSVTEIIFALGQQDRLIARDTTSTYPVAALDLPDVGYVRALSPEGVLSVDPDLILAIEGSGPPETMEVLQAANVPVVMVPEGYDTPAVLAKITVGCPVWAVALA